MAADIVDVDDLRKEASDFRLAGFPRCASVLDGAAEEITKLRERCEAYKGQVEAGADTIDRLIRGEGPAGWTHEFDDTAGHLYYSAYPGRQPPPYMHQREVKAIIDIAGDGTLAGIELIDNMPPPPILSALASAPASDEGMTMPAGRLEDREDIRDLLDELNLAGAITHTQSTAEKYDRMLAACGEAETMIRDLCRSLDRELASLRKLAPPIPPAVPAVEPSSSDLVTALADCVRVLEDGIFDEAAADAARERGRATLSRHAGGRE